MGHDEQQIYFTDVFEVSPKALSKHGAFNISLITDLPLFIDPFLLFNSKKRVYRDLHDEIIEYLRFLRGKAVSQPIDKGLLQAWFMFSEIKQTWLGFSLEDNDGRGLGPKFAAALKQNLSTVFKDFGNETIARAPHLEKLCLIESGVGRDNISDFTTNLIKKYLLEYTQRFTLAHIPESKHSRLTVPKVEFDYEREVWKPGTYTLPIHDNDFVLLTPRDILTRDSVWINRADIVRNFSDVVESVSNDQLRAQLNNYFASQLSKKATQKERDAAAASVARKYPEFIEYYIRYKEDNGDRAVKVSDEKLRASEALYVYQIGELASLLKRQTAFYRVAGNTYAEARSRAEYLKHVIENGGHRLLWVDGRPIRREKDLHILYKLTWYATTSDVSTEVDDGRGPADFKISRGRRDKSIVEFKLASNTQLRRNLAKQAEIYKEASQAHSTLKVVFYFSKEELESVEKILKDLGLTKDESIILVDARKKPSASKA